MLVWRLYMESSRIRNFSIVAHIDHGKSTLADRMLEATHTIEKRKMQEQVLDSMELERERGITIKMTPVRMKYEQGGETYELNLIDTPGHIDFSYEVSRALKAVEGCILLVDATQGVQAQTLTTLTMAREHGLTIIPVLSKIDSPLARIDDVRDEVVSLLHVDPSEVLLVSGRTGEGVNELFAEIIKRIPPPKGDYPDTKSARALIFDFSYSNHRGVILYGFVAYHGLQVFATVFDLDSFRGIFLQGLLSGAVGVCAGIFLLRLMDNRELEEIRVSLHHKFWKAKPIASEQETI